MGDAAEIRRLRAEEEWADLEREEIELNADIAAHQSAISAKQDRLTKLQDYKTALSAFRFGEGHEKQPKSIFALGGPCPIPMDELGMMAGYQAALRAIGTTSPGGYVHARTAGEWLITAGVLEGLSIDVARMRVSKFLSRSREWERVEGKTGWYRYLPEVGPENSQVTTTRDISLAE